MGEGNIECSNYRVSCSARRRASAQAFSAIQETVSWVR